MKMQGFFFFKLSGATNKPWYKISSVSRYNILRNVTSWPTLPYPFCLKNNIYTSYLQASSSKPDSESTLSSSKWLSTSSFSFRSSFASIALSQGFSTVHPKTFHRRKNSQTLILQFDWVFLDTALALWARVLYDYSRRFSRTISQNNKFWLHYPIRHNTTKSITSQLRRYLGM